MQEYYSHLVRQRPSSLVLPLVSPKVDVVCKLPFLSFLVVRHSLSMKPFLTYSSTFYLNRIGLKVISKVVVPVALEFPPYIRFFRVTSCAV